jgi:methylated-DNA-[protein]-cysteine S-methyltransferase
MLSCHISNWWRVATLSVVNRLNGILRSSLLLRSTTPQSIAEIKRTLAKLRLRRYGRLMALRYLDSPVGRLALQVDSGLLTGVRWASAGERSRDRTPSAVLDEAARQLDRYFAGKLKRFDLPLDAHGTAFQKRVWAMMRDIPYGRTATYGGMAMALGSGPRAVGMACGRNPIPIVVPCHRVLASGGKEGGFSGGQGLPTKRRLLALEGVVLL